MMNENDQIEKENRIMKDLIERSHRRIVESFKRLRCPPELIVLYDVLPCTTTYTLAWAAIREQLREEGRDTLALLN
jgi:hypothetical protein